MKYIIIGALFLISKFSLAQHMNEISTLEFKFSISITQNNTIFNPPEKIIDIFSYKDLMLCKLPIYGVYQNDTLKLDGNVELENILEADHVVSHYYALVDRKQKTVLKFKSFIDSNPISSNYDSLYMNLFTFNGQIILPQNNVQIKKYTLGKYYIKEESDVKEHKSYCQKLFFSDDIPPTNFSFSEILEKEEMKKLVKIHVSEKENDREQTVKWEIKKLNEEVPSEIIEFMKLHIK
ncbi:hypothetical protein ACR777_06980 [Sphingobacterium spiritivorum]|uniref:hypothetical protein n=1 Tax=Sphingobacterium spiritivorum TaxID=258 RepID=UPI003DA62918